LIGDQGSRQVRLFNLLQLPYLLWKNLDPASVASDKRVVSRQRSTWDDFVLLQVADFMAYENSKMIDSIESGRECRSSIKSVVDGNNFKGRLAGIPREALIEFRQYLDSVPRDFRDGYYRAGMAEAVILADGMSRSVNALRIRRRDLQHCGEKSVLLVSSRRMGPVSLGNEWQTSLC